MNNCGLVEFAITDGTISIDLLAGNKGHPGFAMQRYTPGRPQMKDGGVWADSPLAVGRQLVTGIDTNTSDALTLVCGDNTQAGIIKAFEGLDLLLDKARAYWTTTWQQVPVYIRARAKGETSRRYALIHYAKYDEYFNPYGELFAGDKFKLATEEFILGIERGLWLDLPPGESVSIPLTHIGNSGDPIDASGSVLEDEGLIVGNMHQAIDPPGNIGGLLYVLRDDGGSFSGNLLDSALPYNLVNSPEATGDTFYFGAQNPFFGVVLNLTNLSTGSTRVWEYWNGTSWTTFTPRSNTTHQILTTTGVGHVVWIYTSISNWAKTTVSTAPSLYWVRVRTTSGGGGGPLTQGVRHPYATAHNYIEIDPDEVLGTRNALISMDINLWHPSLVSTPLSTTGSLVWVGLRSVDRGERFTAHLNVLSGNPSGISFDAGGWGNLVQDVVSPGGAVISVTNSNFQSRAATIAFSSFDGIHQHYFGRFRLIIRVHTFQTDNSDCLMRYHFLRPITATSDMIIITGDTKVIPNGTARYHLVDLGPISIPASERMLYSDSTGTFKIGLDASIPSGKTIHIDSVILLPIDEWTAEITGQVAINNNILQVRLDGVGNPKGARAYVEAADELLLSSRGSPILPAGARQRFWFLFTNIHQFGSPTLLASVRLRLVQRNFGLRSAD